MYLLRKAAWFVRSHSREWPITQGRRWLALAPILCLSLIALNRVGKYVVAMGSFGAGNRVLAMEMPPSQAAASLKLPGKSEILAIMRKVNSYQLEHPITEVTGSGQPITDPLRHPWPRIVWYNGVMAAWRVTKEPSFLGQSVAYGRQLQWQVGKERIGPNRLFPVQLWAEIYFAKKDRAMIEPSIQWLATPDPLSPAGSKLWYLDARGKGAPIPYADSLFGAPALAMLAQITGDKKYLDIMNAFFDDVTAPLFDKDSGLYYRDPTYIGQRTANGKKVLWSRGNGWVFAGIPRILDYLPAHDSSRQRYLKIFLLMAPALAKRQGADGLWRVNLDDPAQYPNPETSGTGFFCYGFAWGINHGVLGRKEYLPVVQKAWAGLTQSLSPEGKVLWGQGVDAEPNSVARDSTHEFVTGTFLLAASEVYKLAH